MIIDMKRPLQIAFDCCAAISLVSCIACAILWVRSNSRWDQLFFARDSRLCIIESGKVDTPFGSYGGIRVVWAKPWRGAAMGSWHGAMRGGISSMPDEADPRLYLDLPYGENSTHEWSNNVKGIASGHGDIEVDFSTDGQILTGDQLMAMQGNGKTLVFQFEDVYLPHWILVAGFLVLPTINQVRHGFIRRTRWRIPCAEIA